MSLTSLKQQLTSVKTIVLGILVVALVIFLVAVIIFQYFLKPQPASRTPSEIPPSLSKQPVVDGQFDESAEVSQRSKATINALKSSLPYRTTITTSAGQEVAYVIFTDPLTPYTIYMEMLGVNFRATHEDPLLPKYVQDFRDTASDIFSWMRQQGVEPGDIFISWGDQAFIQENAEAWLVPSEKFPKVARQKNQFIFETEPVY